LGIVVVAGQQMKGQGKQAMGFAVKVHLMLRSDIMMLLMICTIDVSFSSKQNTLVLL